ncbi:hypothetical protein Barb4_01999 [Bacteroidales bacterium Barb4]|nr:hypothetical protein Barb4_01999 [Bacteroidales bacterium Barb4]
MQADRFFRTDCTEIIPKWRQTSDTEHRSRAGRVKIKLDPVKDLLPQLIENHSRNLNPVLNELEKKHGIKVCKSTLQTFLKGVRFQAEARANARN